MFRFLKHCFRNSVYKSKQVIALAQSGLIIGGAVLAASSKDGSAAEALGGLAMMGGAGWAVADSIKYDLERATTSEKVPENHLGHIF